MNTNKHMGRVNSTQRKQSGKEKQDSMAGDKLDRGHVTAKTGNETE